MKTEYCPKTAEKAKNYCLFPCFVVFQSWQRLVKPGLFHGARSQTQEILKSLLADFMEAPSPGIHQLLKSCKNFVFRLMIEVAKDAEVP